MTEHSLDLHCSQAKPYHCVRSQIFDTVVVSFIDVVIGEINTSRSGLDLSRYLQHYQACYSCRRGTAIKYNAQHAGFPVPSNILLTSASVALKVPHRMSFGLCIIWDRSAPPTDGDRMTTEATTEEGVPRKQIPKPLRVRRAITVNVYRQLVTHSGSAVWATVPYKFKFTIRHAAPHNMPL